MSLLSVSNLAFRYPSQSEPLFTHVSFDINFGDRVGVVGPNGAGKTTLLRILAGELAPHGSAVVRRRQLRWSFVPQGGPPNRVEDRLSDYALTADPALGEMPREIRALESRLDDAERAGRYADLVHLFEERSGFQRQAEAVRVLAGLGFGPRERQLPLSQLSSGQRVRAELARLLVAPVDLLLIDEPTDHLDIAAREWLEGYLDHVRAAYLVVSHDRMFLSRATNRIFELRRQALTVYEGNYEFYVRERALRERQAWERYAAQQRRVDAVREASERRMTLSRRVAKTPQGVRAGKDFYASKSAKVARTARILRERAVAETAVGKPWVEDPIPPLQFQSVPRSRGVVLRAEGISKSYGDKLLFRDLNVCVHAGSRWVITGPNGCGKTTLLRILLGYEKPDQGEVHMGAHVRAGYYVQEGENLDLSKSPLDLCLEVHRDETWVRTILGCLRQRGEGVTRPLEAMSAGERAKVALARLLLGGANLLLLDELTSHLDIEAREAVEQTLQAFPGTILFVSHDRYFVKQLADNFLELAHAGCVA